MSRRFASGSIAPAGANRWRIRFELGRDSASGSRRRRDITIEGSKRKAQRILSELLAQRDRGIDIAPERVTVAEYLERWLEDAARGRVSPRTCKRYAQLVRRVSPTIGAYRLEALRPTHMSAAYTALLNEGLTAQTVLHHHRVLKQALQQAVRWQLIGLNPAEAVIPPRPQRREMRALDGEEVGRLLAASRDEDLRRLIFVAVATGLRLGELLGLKWRDVDLGTHAMSIQRTAQYIDGVDTFSSPKTQRSHRTVAFSSSTTAVLQEHRRSQLARRLRVGELWQDHDLVFCREDGSPARVSNVSHRFAHLARTADLPVRFHDLRHTMATIALRAGVHPKVVSERLGHASVQITLDTYSHVMPDIQGEAAEAIERVLPDPGRAAMGERE